MLSMSGFTAKTAPSADNQPAVAKLFKGVEANVKAEKTFENSYQAYAYYPVKKALYATGRGIKGAYNAIYNLLARIGNFVKANAWEPITKLWTKSDGTKQTTTTPTANTPTASTIPAATSGSLGNTPVVKTAAIVPNPAIDVTIPLGMDSTNSAENQQGNEGLTAGNGQ